MYHCYYPGYGMNGYGPMSAMGYGMGGMGMGLGMAGMGGYGVSHLPCLLDHAVQHRLWRSAHEGTGLSGGIGR